MKALDYTKILADLIAAKALIDTPEKWLKGKLSNGNTTFKDKDATCFCSFGAAGRVTGSLAQAGNIMGLLDSCVPEAFKNLPGLEIGEEGKAPVISHCDAIAYNDAASTTHEDIMALWDRAIAKSKAYIVRDNLIAAEALIATPERWTQKVYARDADGASVNFYAGTASCFCSVGAVRAVNPIDVRLLPKSKEIEYLNDAVKARGVDGIVAYNDHWNRKHEEVIAVFNEAIERAIKEAKAI